RGPHGAAFLWGAGRTVKPSNSGHLVCFGRLRRWHGTSKVGAAMGRVFVTGMGVVSSLGFGRKAYWEALVEGRSGIREVSVFDTSGLPRNLGGEVKDFRATDFMSEAEARRMGRCSAFSVAAARMAV